MASLILRRILRGKNYKQSVLKGNFVVVSLASLALKAINVNYMVTIQMRLVDVLKSPNHQFVITVILINDMLARILKNVEPCFLPAKGMKSRFLMNAAVAVKQCFVVVSLV